MTEAGVLSNAGPLSRPAARAVHPADSAAPPRRVATPAAQPLAVGGAPSGRAEGRADHVVREWEGDVHCGMDSMPGAKRADVARLLPGWCKRMVANGALAVLP